MPDYRLTILVKDVTEDDATGLAQQIHDNHGSEFDEVLGDFSVVVSKLERDNAYPIDWSPED